MPGDEHAVDDGAWALGFLASRADVDHGRDERDPAQHHRRAAARPAEGAERTMTHRRRRARPRRSRRATRATAIRTTLWTRLRAEEPVAYFAPEGFEPFWAITKHADILEISKQPLRFSSAAGITLRRAGAPVYKSDMVVMLDPPEHGPVRKVANGRFTPKAVRARRDDIDRIALEILDEAAPAGAEGDLDFVERIAAPFPLGGDRVDPRRAERRLAAAVPVDQRGDRQGRPRVPARGRDRGPDDQAGSRRGARLLPAPDRSTPRRTRRTT